MAYFLGIKTPEGLKPLKICDKEGKSVPNSILNLVAFTSSFNDSYELQDYLKDNRILDDYSGKFYYLIDKGQKGHKTYLVVPGTDNVIYSHDRNNFIARHVRNKLHNKSLNTDFIEHLYAFYLKKYGILNKSVNAFKNIGGQPYEMRKAILSLLRFPLSEQMGLYLYQILDIINTAIERDSVRFFKGNESKIYFDLIDQVDIYFEQNDKDLISFCRGMSSMIQSNSIGALNYLNLIYRLVCCSEIGLEKKLSLSEYEDLDYYIDQFLDFTIYNYDKKSSDFKRENGKRKLQERNLFDLGIFLSDYDSFEVFLYQSMDHASETALDTDSEHEEFLEEEDFRRLNTTSEEQGITLRMTDDLKYGNKW